VLKSISRGAGKGHICGGQRSRHELLFSYVFVNAIAVIAVCFGEWTKHLIKMYVAYCTCLYFIVARC